MANKVTQKAGLTFNVNTVKNKLREFYESQDISIPMFSGGQTSITAVLQKILEMILKECVKHVGKDKSGVRQVNRDFIVHSLLLHPGFKQYFSSYLDRFDAEQMYKDQIPISQTEMDKVLESVDSNLSLSQKGRNMACYLILKVFLDLAHTCTQLLEFAKKKSCDARCVMFAVSVKFPENLSVELRNEIVQVAKAFGDDLESNSSNAEEVPKQEQADATENENEDESKTKSKKAPPKGETKKAVVKGAKGTNKSDDEPDDSVEIKKPTKNTHKTIDSDGDNNEDLQDDELVEVKPVKQPGKTAQPAKGGKVTTSKVSKN
jgi:hypothetical protein